LKKIRKKDNKSDVNSGEKEKENMIGYVIMSAWLVWVESNLLIFRNRKLR